MKLSCFQEEMIVKENPIKIGEENFGKETYQRKIMWWLTGMSNTFKRKETRLTFSIGSRQCRQSLEPVDSQKPRIGFTFSFRARSSFFFWWTLNRTQILFIEGYVFKD